MSGRENGHGAARVIEHAVLGPLPPAADVAFTFDGAPMSARAGEPIIAALLAAGVRSFRTMPKTGESRGGFCMVGRCADCLVVVDGVPNRRSCITPVDAGMRVETQRGLGNAAWPTFDAEAIDGTGRDERSA